MSAFRNLLLNKLSETYSNQLSDAEVIEKKELENSVGGRLTNEEDTKEVRDTILRKEIVLPTP